MTEENLLIGSLSSDLFRIASSTYRGSMVAADRFNIESKKWLLSLKKYKPKHYISKILHDLENNLLDQKNDLEKAEKCLMYATLLENYALKNIYA